MVLSENNATLSEDWMGFSDRSSVVKVRQRVGGWVGEWLGGWFCLENNATLSTYRIG